MNTCDFITKYRPVKLDKTLFTSDVKSKVDNILKDDNISAIVITGGVGSGKTTLARICAVSKGREISRSIGDCVIGGYDGVHLNSEDMQIATADVLILDDFESIPAWRQREIVEEIRKQGICRFAVFVTCTESALADEVKQFCQETVSTEVDCRSVYMSIVDICNKEGIAYDIKEGIPHSTGLKTLETFVLEHRSSNIRTVLTCLEFCKSKGISLEDGVKEFFKGEFNYVEQ